MLESTLLPDFYRLEYTLLPRSNRSALLNETYFSNYGGSLIAHIFLMVYVLDLVGESECSEVLYTESFREELKHSLVVDNSET